MQADVPKRLERLVGQIHIEPSQLLVITPNDQIIPERVNVHTTDPLETGLECLDELVACQII